MPNIQEVLLLNGKAIGAFPSSGGGIRYDAENDVVQLYYDGQWRDWKSGGMAYPIGTEILFNYLGDIEEFTIPATGDWKLECWGASGGAGSGVYAGGSAGGAGGLGGYATGVAHFEVDSKIYIACGARGTVPNTYTNAFNGGGKGALYSGGGGGATHIAKTNLGVLANYDMYRSELLIVAGGGGGGGYIYNGGSLSGKGGNGGGTSGERGGNTNTSIQGGYGGTQSAGGAGGGSNGLAGSFGTGGNGDNSGAAGGGGWYGGGSGELGGNNYAAAGGGGSSYIGSSELSDTSTLSGQWTGDGKAKLTYLG